MAKPGRVSVTLNFGRQDKIDPKHAPFGVLRSAKNLRHREQGGLGMRHGYQLAGNGTITGTLVAYDLHEYQGRLLALGSDQLENYPHDLLEYTNLPNQTWRSAQGIGNRFAVSPFTNAREVAGVPQLEGGVDHTDAVSGGGYTLVVYRSTDNLHTYATIVDSRTNQTVHFEDLSNGGFGHLLSFERAAFAGGKFFILATLTNDNSVKLCSFEVGVSSGFTAFATVDGSNANPVTAADLVPVTHNSTALLCVAFDRGTSTDLSVLVYQSNGTQLGSTIAVSGTNTLALALDADQTDNTILLATLEGSTTAKLRTFNFSGSLLAGPTTVHSPAQSISVARTHPGTGGSDTAYVACKDSFDTLIRSCAVDDHSGLATAQTLYNASPTTRLYSFPARTISLVLGTGAPDRTTNNQNLLVHIGASAVHAFARDYQIAQAPLLGLPTNITYDATTGALSWCSFHNQPGTIGINKFPTVTLVDYRSTARVQACTYGGLRYFAGAAPWIYDGRAATEAGFFEPPTIVSVTPDSSAGSMTPSAKYTYVAHWEVTYADGSFYPSAPSLPFDVTMGASDTENTVVVTGPHTLRTVLGGSALGASVTLVLSRTEWSPTTVDPVSGSPGAQLSVFRRTQEVDLEADVTLYGQSTTIVDATGDDTLGTRGAIYTQGADNEFSGALENNAPEACSYIMASEAHIWTGGLLRPYEVQVSREAFIGQPFTWSFLSSFYTQVSKAVVGVFSLDQFRLIATTDDLYAIGNNTPDDEGKGTLDLPVRIPTPSGLKDWRSFLEESGGLWFQLDSDKLFRMPRGGGAPAWDGKEISLLLASYPTITAATKHKADNVALFACNNTGLTDARIAVRDLLFDTWLVDTPPLQSSKGIEALCGFGRTVGYVSGGVVYVQSETSFADLGTNFIDCEAELQPIYPFGLGGYGLIYETLITAEYRGDCQLTVSASYDDGLTYPFSNTFVVAGLTPGATIRKKWTLPQNQTDRVMLKLDVNTNGAPSEGLIINEVTLYGEDQGGSPELPPGDSA